jgi:hypothetical protein
MTYLLILFPILQLGDIITTLYGIDIGLTEKNKVTKYIIDISRSLFVGLKILLGVGVCVFLYHMSFYSHFWSLVVIIILDVMYTYVVVKNIRGIYENHLEV